MNITPVVVLALCEAKRVVLKSGVTYRFEADVDCRACRILRAEELAESAEERASVCASRGDVDGYLRNTEAATRCHRMILLMQDALV